MKPRYVVAVAALYISVTLRADEPKAYKPTEIQSLRLQVRQKDAQLAQANLQVAQQQFQAALANLTAEAEKVKLEQKWPADTQFSPNDLSFSAPVPAKDVKK